MNVTYNQKIIDKSDESMRKIKQRFAKIMYTIESDAKRLAPVDTGYLRNNIHTDKISDTHFIVRSSANYSACVEFGTKAHIIKPVEKQVLHWKKGEEDFFAKRVQHPGTTAQPFMRPAFKMAKLRLKKFIK